MPTTGSTGRVLRARYVLQRSTRQILPWNMGVLEVEINGIGCVRSVSPAGDIAGPVMETPVVRGEIMDAINYR